MSKFNQAALPLPIIGASVYALCQFIVLLPILFYDRELPISFMLPKYDAAIYLSLLLVALGHALLVFSIIYLCTKAFQKRQRTVLSVNFVILISTLILSLAAVFYYIKFGGYPSAQIIRDLLSNPTVFWEYTNSGLIRKDIILFVIMVALLGWLSLVSARDYGKVCLRRGSFTLSTTVALIFILIGLEAGTLGRFRNLNRVAGEHSTPIFKLYMGISRFTRSDSMNMLIPYVPRGSGEYRNEVNIPAKHVFLVIMEAVRADHTPFYGYQTNTFPKLKRREAELITFKEAFANGCTTETSFPAIFNSQYLSNESKSGRAAQDFWEILNKAGIKSAFISAGALEWGQLDQRLHLDKPDYLFSAGMASKNERRIYAKTDKFDYAVDDRIALKKLYEFLGTLTALEKSFSVLHLVASHFPYNSDPTFDQFQPSMRLENSHISQGIRPKSTETEAIINSYHNSLLFVDNSLEDLLEELKRRRILEDSLLIITSDHGEAFGEHNAFFHGGNIHNEQIKVPLLIRLGENLNQLRPFLMRNVNLTSMHVNLLPTVLDSFNLPMPKRFEGISLFGELNKPYEMVAYNSISEKIAFFKGKQKYMYDIATSEALQFDLNQDANELKNLWNQPTNSLEEFLSTLEKQNIIRKLPSN